MLLQIVFLKSKIFFSSEQMRWEMQHKSHFPVGGVS